MLRFCDLDDMRGRFGKLGPWGGLLQRLCLVLLMASLSPVLAEATVTLSLSSATGGVTISGTRPSYKAGFGDVNGLGVGTPGSGVSLITTGVSGGALYTTPYNIVISGMNATHYATVSVYVSTNFSRSTILILRSCYPSASCTSATSFTTISTSPASPTPIITSPGIQNSTVTASLGLFAANTNGGGVTTGSDTATLTFTATDLTNGRTSSVTLALNTPSENLQEAVQLLLATYTGGLTISPASDFSMNYGDVNGLGIGQGTGLTVTTSAAGAMYSTPYLIEPSFSSFSSTTSSVSVYVSMNFTHSAILTLNDAAASGGPYTAISTSSSSPTSLTTTAGSGSSVTRYLGLFVSGVNGATAFTGADSATLTYTMTVP
jgi:hypothetical protein